MTFSNNGEDQELLLKMQDGDVNSFDIIYHRYRSVLYMHAYRKLQNSEEVCDILQDVFSNLWENRNRLNITENLGGYLIRSVRNRVINVITKGQRAEAYINSFEHFLSYYHCDTDLKVREKMITDLVEREIASLPDRMRQVFELSRKEGLSHKEISDLLGITEQSVRSHIKGALRILRLRFVLLIYCLIVFS
ncbi:RNA polymerase sigma factor [Sphingobacterium spiritivorum]|uniref:RNA polymerase sigma factor n=1 Tax=Sphingobacterium spiritivorum TaxID=258 RepID=UPI003DA266CC